MQSADLVVTIYLDILGGVGVADPKKIYASRIRSGVHESVENINKSKIWSGQEYINI